MCHLWLVNNEVKEIIWCEKIKMDAEKAAAAAAAIGDDGKDVNTSRVWIPMVVGEETFIDTEVLWVAGRYQR